MFEVISSDQFQEDFHRAFLLSGISPSSKKCHPVDAQFGFLECGLPMVGIS